MSTFLDAVGRPLQVGDTVGGTATQPYPDTIVGTVKGMNVGAVTVEATSSHNGKLRNAGEIWTLPLSQTFFLGRPLAGVLEMLGIHLAQYGDSPALFYITPAFNDARMVTRIDQAAPPDQRERDVCHALVLHARTVLDEQRQAGLVADDGPTLVYLACDRATLTRVDHSTVEDPRERSICQALLKQAERFCREPVGAPPVCVGEDGRVLP